ncbi:MAG TPA: TonB-dependent receptor [Candidatus Polarisedimenticolia bacterium]|nr:TonB-dependent receptor [Candidatus Polarisedimenticolia bacterium]
MRQPALPDSGYLSVESTPTHDAHGAARATRAFHVPLLALSTFFHRSRGAILLGLLLAAGPVSLRAQEKATGALRGSVMDRELGSPLPGARVAVVGTVLATVTSPEGTFLLPQVPVGSYSVSFTKTGYERQLLTGVTVNAGRLTELKVEMGIEVVEMEELVVSGTEAEPAEETGLLDLRSEAVSFQDAISADLISKAGASDVAGALKFVVGTSITEGKYATVRGLSDRYTGTTLNGVRVPSADPRRRAVQVDLFPTGTVESLTVTKTFTPDLQGEFTGGGVDIRTKSIPEKRTFSVSMSAEANSQATGNEDFLTYEGGGIPFGGGGARDRALPEEADEAIPLPPRRYKLAPTADEMKASQTLDRLVRSFAPVMGVTQETPGYNNGFSFVGGNRWEVGSGVTLGLLGALNYLHKFEFYRQGLNNNGTISVPDQPLGGSSRVDTRGTEESLTGLLINFEMRLGENQRYALNLVGNQAAEDEARFQVQNLGASLEQNQSLHYTQRLVTSLQLHGEQHFPSVKDLALDWFFASNSTRQEEPDVRFFRNGFNPSTLEGVKPANSSDPQNTRRIWRDVEEGNYQAAVNVRKSFPSWGDLPAVFQGGVRLDRTDRNYDQRSFTYQFPNQTDAGTNDAVRENQEKAKFHATRADQLWTDVFSDSEFIGLAPNIVISTPQRPPAPDQLLWIITPLASDVNYTGDQSVDGLYGMVEFPFQSNLRAVAGVRMEKTKMSVVPVNDVTGRVEVINVLPSGDREISRPPQEDAHADIQDTSLLPSVGLIWSIRQGMALRATASGTLARPTFRELAPIATEEFIFGDEYVGNPDLILSKIVNYDLRWEWFPGPGIILAASGFYKQIRHPIELISFAVANRSFIQPVNYPRGRVTGVELEARSHLGWIHEWLQGIAVGVNYAAMQSEAEVPASEQAALETTQLDEPTIRLIGQPDRIWNANLTFDSEKAGTSAGIFYNFSGESLLTGAARGVEDAVPNVFQESFKTLDVTVSQRLGKGFWVSFKGKNLLTQPLRSVYRTPSGQEAVKTERESASLLGLSLSWKW